MRTKHEASSQDEQRDEQNDGGHGSTATRAVAAAAATGAVTYAVHRALSHRAESAGDEASEDESGEGSLDRQQQEGSRRGVLAKKDDLAETLSSKATDVKKAAGGLRPKKNVSVAASAWGAASAYLIPLAEEAAAAAGRAAADKTPETVRAKVIPRFIEAFEEAT